MTGIPYNPQCQGIFERAQETIKNTIQKFKRSEFYPILSTPPNILHLAFIIL